MNLFCRLFGHTWWPETIAPPLRWNTTKDGHTLVSTIVDQEVRHIEVCKRCGETRDAGRRRHDDDRPADALAPGAAEAEPEPEKEAG